MKKLAVLSVFLLFWTFISEGKNDRRKFIPKNIIAQGENEPPHVFVIEDVYSSKYLPGSPIYTKNGFAYFLKFWRDNIKLFLTFDSNQKANFWLTLSHKRLMEAQVLAETKKCSVVPSPFRNYQNSIVKLSHFIQDSQGKNRDIAFLTSRVFNSLSAQEGVFKRVNYFCPQKESEFQESFTNLKKTVEKYWGLDQLKKFHEEKIRQ